MKGRGINKSKVIEISKLKKESKWMRDFRINSYLKFEELPNPDFGPELQIDFDDITYYKKVANIENNWDNVPKDIKDTFDKLGLIEAEQKYLSGVGAQVESEVIYHNMLKELESKNIIFCDTDTALKKYPEIFELHIKRIPNEDVANLFAQSHYFVMPYQDIS